MFTKDYLNALVITNFKSHYSNLNLRSSLKKSNIYSMSTKSDIESVLSFCNKMANLDVKKIHIPIL